MSDQPHILSRRQILQTALGAGAGAILLGGPRLLGSSGVGVGADDALAATACTLTPEQEEGPFYVALEKIRSNIVAGRTGVPLTLRITIVDSSTCKPLKGAAVDIWQADATGRYSDESSEGTVGQTWLRGVQLTNASGLATFKTIYPGFYSGRAPHIHAKVHVGGTHSTTKYSGGHVSHNGQIFFPEALSTKVYKTSPYTKDTNTRTYRKGDRVYTGQHGSTSVLKLTGGSVGAGLTGTITLAVDTSANR
jgi:protocatechuate 3,4-dioxygenase beta subunit